MTSVLHRALDAGFGHPRGLVGRVGGALMARGNAAQERGAVGDAELRPSQHVLVVGPGPGVGLQLAAAAVAPDGHVVGVDPSPTMRAMAATRCAAHIADGVVELRVGTAENTGCPDRSVHAAISVNNVMLWELDAGLAELHRVLRPGGRLVISVHRHVLAIPPEQLAARAAAQGFTDISLTLEQRRRNSPAVRLRARRPAR